MNRRSIFALLGGAVLARALPALSALPAAPEADRHTEHWQHFADPPLARPLRGPLVVPITDGGAFSEGPLAFLPVVISDTYDAHYFISPGRTPADGHFSSLSEAIAHESARQAATE